MLFCWRWQRTESQRARRGSGGAALHHSKTRALVAHRGLVEAASAIELAEVESSKIPDLQKKGKRENIRRRHEATRLRRRRIQAMALRAVDGTLLASMSSIGQALCQH